MRDDPIDPGRTRAGGLTSLAARCVAHPWRTVAAWIAAAPVVVGLAVGVGGSLVGTVDNPGAETRRAQDLPAERAWWIPRRLDRLPPSLTIEPPAAGPGPGRSGSDSAVRGEA